MAATLSIQAPSARVSWRQYQALLVRYLRPYTGRVVLLGLLILAGTGVQILSPQIAGRFVDAVQAGRDSAFLAQVALLFLVAALVRRLLAVATTYLTQDVKWRATNRLRSDLAGHCLRLPLSFHDHHTPGQMVERIDGDVMALSNFFSTLLLQLVANALLLLGTLAALALRNVALGLAFAGYAVVTLALMQRTAPRAVPAWQAERAASADLYGFLEERLAGIEDLRACGAEAHTLRGYYQAMRRQFLALRRAWLVSTLPWAVAASMFAVNEAAGFLIGLRLFEVSAISLGTVYLILQYNAMIQQPLESFSRQAQDLQGATASILRIQELLDQPEEKPDRPLTLSQNTVLPCGALGVRFENVSFAYAEGSEVLRDVSFALPPGQVLGLLGRTGSGKTTVARLLCRLYKPAAGAIWLGDDGGWIDTASLPLGEVRGRIGTVTQNVQLFGANLRDNLTLFAACGERANDATIIAALQELGLGEWYRRQPQGLDTLLEGNGAGLSAGQAQLLAMARLFLQNADIVILDEATSRLDPATERLVERATARLLAGRTAIVIAHRLSTVERADSIVILQEGRVVEEGERGRLVADPGSRFNVLLQTGLAEVLA